jgi:hypothetical protein
MAKKRKEKAFSEDIRAERPTRVRARRGCTAQRKDKVDLGLEVSDVDQI